MDNFLKGLSKLSNPGTALNSVISVDKFNDDVISNISGNEINQVHNNMTKLICENSQSVSSLSVVFTLIGVYFAYRSFCRISPQWRMLFLVVYLCTCILPIYDLVENSISSKEDNYKKCIKMSKGEIRQNVIFYLLGALNIILFFIIFYYGFCSLFFNFENNCDGLQLKTRNSRNNRKRNNRNNRSNRNNKRNNSN